MKRILIVLLLLPLISCATSNAFKYADEKADRLTVENTQKDNELAIKDAQITELDNFIANFRNAIIRSKSAFTKEQIDFFNSLRLNIGEYVPPVKEVWSDTTINKGVKK